MNTIINEPVVSIIIPIYNTSEYLERCINSVIAQTYKNIEIILVNDGSTDDSGKICEEYAVKDSRINVIHKENGGLSDARNAGIDIASGEYIAFVDSDDFISRIYVQVLLTETIRNNADIAICNYVKGSGSIFPKQYYNKVKIQCYSEKEMLSNWHGKYKRIETMAWNKLYKTTLFKDYGIRYPMGYYHEDVPTTHLLVSKARRIIVINRKLYYYYQREDSITSNITVKKIEDSIFLQNERRKWFLQNGYSSSAQRLLIKMQKYYILIYCKIDDSIFKQIGEDLFLHYANGFVYLNSFDNISLWERLIFGIFNKNPIFIRSLINRMY